MSVLKQLSKHGRMKSSLEHLWRLYRQIFPTQSTKIIYLNCPEQYGMLKTIKISMACIDYDEG